MATKTLITRIKNKVDTYANWKGTTGLLDGEIAIVRVTTEEVTPAGEVVHVPALLMKVGAKDSNNNPIPFDDLPWLSAKASDVYSWAKAQDPSGITVKYTKDNSEVVSASLATVLKDLREAQSDIDQLEADLADVRGTLSVDPASAGDGVVQGISYDAATGKFTVSYGLVQTADIADNAVTTAKITDGNVTTAKIADSNVTTVKIADGAVTNDKLGSDISTDKINVGTGTTSGSLSAKIAKIESDITDLNNTKHDKHEHPYLPDTTAYAAGATQGGAAVSANKVNAAVTFNNSGSGAVSGTTFDGSTARTVSYNTIGAAPASHTHNDIYYTEDEVNSKLDEKADKNHNHDDNYAPKTHNHDDRYYTEGEVDNLINTKLASVLKYKGTKATLNDLPKEGNETGDVWNISNAGTLNGVTVSAGDNVAWNGTGWDVLAGTVDLSNYYNKSEVNSKLDEKAEKEHTHTIITDAEDDGVVLLTSANGSNGVYYKATHAASGVDAGTYRSVTVDAKGHVTAGANPTTISGYGITDAYTKDDVNSKLAEKVDKSDSRLTDARAPLAHNHASNEVTAMTGYSKPSSTSAIAATDSLNTAIGKLEKALDGKGTSNLTLGGNGSATTAAKSDHNHDSTYGQAITDIQNNYVKVAANKMYLGSDVIIFDCGGADEL